VITLRIWQPRRLVFRIRRQEGGNALGETWIVLRRAPPDWKLIFCPTLDLIWLPNESRSGQIELAGQLGWITWQERTITTRIVLRIEGFSSQKRALIATTLWKAARFNEIQEA
jgi:hypothetical protein